MSPRLSLWKRLLLLLLIVPVAAWAVVGPVRVVAPQWAAGVSCPEALICLDDAARLPEAQQLYREALAFVADSVGAVRQAPRIVFCATQACAEAFGLGRRSALSFATFGIVIGPRAWQPHYVRHELIHHLQGERLGLWPLLRGPDWLIEGMAYALSEDPRPVLPQPFERCRAEFRAWQRDLDHRGLWEAASRL